MTIRRRFQNLAPSIAAALLAMLIAGCAVKTPPDATEVRALALPTVQLPAQWTGTALETIPHGWLADFNDAELTAAVLEALAHNADLRVAAARVEEARLYARLAGAKLYPQVDLLGHGGTKLGDTSGLQGLIVSATWELDIWGRVRAGRAAAGNDAMAVLLDFEYARQSLAALVAKSWFLATEAGLQLAAARETLRGGDELERLAGERARVGVGGQEEVFVARANAGATRDIILQLELARGQAIRALELLLGRYPSAAATPAPQLPGYPGEIPAGLPSALLERRPDVVAAERRVAAAFNRIQEAQAARLPAIALTSGVSAISSDLFVLQDHDNPVWSLGLNLLTPLFRGGALKTQVEIRTAEQQRAVAAYGAVGIRAFGEVEGALAAEIAARDREKVLAQVMADNQQALNVVQAQFRVGSTDLRFVEQRQLALSATQSSLIRVQTEQRVQRVNLYLALGGSFELQPPQPPSEPVPAGTQPAP